MIMKELKSTDFDLVHMKRSSS